MIIRVLLPDNQLLFCFGVLLWIGVLLGIGGCSAPRPAPSGQETPELVVQKWKKALLDNDPDRLLECCYPWDDGWPAAQKAWLKFIHANIGLRNALLEAYGDDAWERVENSPDAGVLPQVCDEAHLDKITKTILVSNDGDFAVLADSGFPLKLIQVDGIWYYNYRSGALNHNAKSEKKELDYYRKLSERLTSEVHAKTLSPQEAGREYSKGVMAYND